MMHDDDMMMYVFSFWGLVYLRYCIVLLKSIYLDLDKSLKFNLCKTVACLPHQREVWDGWVVGSGGTTIPPPSHHCSPLHSFRLIGGWPSRGSGQSVLLENLRLNIKGGLEREPGRWCGLDCGLCCTSKNKYLSYFYWISYSEKL